MSEKPVFMTEEGLRKLREELEHLVTAKRREIADKIHAAKEEGDIMENSAYDEAKNEQAFLEGRIRTLEVMLKNAVIIHPDRNGDRITVGAYVTVRDGEGPPETFRIVGSAEADPRSGLISNESPVGKALLGRKLGETVEVTTPGGMLTFEILDVGWDGPAA